MSDDRAAASVRGAKDLLDWGSAGGSGHARCLQLALPTATRTRPPSSRLVRAANGTIHCGTPDHIRTRPTASQHQYICSDGRSLRPLSELRGVRTAR